MICLISTQAFAQFEIQFPQAHFWVSETSGDVYRSKVFGRGGISEDRVLADAAAQGLNVSNDIAARSIDLDQMRGKVYWSVYENEPTIMSTIFRMNLDGSDLEPFRMVDGAVSGLQVDAAGERVYWVESNTTTFFSRLMSTNLEGGDETLHLDSDGLTIFGFGDTPLFWDLELDADAQHVWFFLRGTEVPVGDRGGFLVLHDLESGQVFLESRIREPNFYPDPERTFVEEIMFDNLPSIAVDPMGESFAGTLQRNFALAMGWEFLYWGREGAVLSNGGFLATIGVTYTEVHYLPGTSTEILGLFNMYVVLNRLLASFPDPNTTEFGGISQYGEINGDFTFHSLVAAEGHRIGTAIPHTGNVLNLDADFIESDFAMKVSKDGYPEDFDGDGFPESAGLALLLAAHAQYSELYGPALFAGYVQNIDLLAQETDVDDLPVHREVLAALFLLGSEVKAELIDFLHKRGIILSQDYVTLTADDSSRAANEPLSGSGDFDGDGVSNRDEYLNTIDAGGTIEQFVEAALGIRSSGGGGGGNCLIATYASGTPLEHELVSIRSFRDSVMLSNPLGAAISKTYYQLSAWWLGDH
jgi:hypothetical protein